MGAKKEKLDHSQVIDRPMQEWSRIFRIQSRCYGYKVEYNRNQELVYVPDFVSRIDRFNPTSAVICHQKVFSKFWPTIWVNTALAFLKHPEKFPEDYDKVPYNYIRFHTDEVIERIVADDDVEALEALINLLGKKVDLQLIDEIIEQAGDRVNIRHYMIDLKNRKYSKEEQEKLRSILEEKELGIRELTVAEWKKLWAYKKLDNGGIVLTGYKGDEENLIVPARIGKTPVTAIGDHVLVPERKRYDSEALARKDRIRTVMIPEGIEEIGEQAFADCPGLESISIPTSLKKLGEGAFSNCHGLADAEGFVIVGGVLFNYYGSNETLTIPEGVTRIDSRAFYGNSVIREVIMPEGLKTIGRRTFYFCQKLRKTVMPDGLENIGDEAFGNCKALEKAAVPDSVKKMGYGAFLNCSHLADTEGFMIIQNVLFNYYGAETEVIIPANVKRIDMCAFEHNRKLESVILPERLEYIGEKAFHDCPNLKDIRLYEHVTTIDVDAFSGCRSMTTLGLPEKLQTIGAGAFEDTGLTEITIPGSVEVLPYSVFARCKELKTLKVQEGVLVIGEASFYACDKLKTVDLPKSVRTIGNRAFGKCESLITINIPYGCVSLGRGAFEDCTKLEEARLPETLVSIASETFSKCWAMKEISIPDSVREIGTDAFGWGKKIRGKPGSYAQQYAKGHRFQFVES